MKYCMYFVLVCFVAQQIIFAGTPLKIVKDNKNNDITLERFDDKEMAEDLKDHRIVFNNAFWAARVQSGLATEGDEGARQAFFKLISSSMDEVKRLLLEAKNVTFGISAKKGEALVGFIIFSHEHSSEVVYINQCAICPAEWKSGIATQLVKAILLVLPDTKKIQFVARRKNKIAQAFYAHCAEKYPTLQQTDYMHDGYDPTVYQGYEFFIPADFF